MFPISENRIQRIITKGKRLIDSHNVVFFDVFDTLITRDCSKPMDVFELVEQTYNKAVKDSNLCNFCRMRQEAEKRSAKTVTAPNLDEIYDHLSLDALQKIKLKDIEIDIERKLTVKKYTGYTLYQYAKQQGKLIVAVSDMYLGSSVIRELLVVAGYSIDNVFVSCDYRAEKHNGKLFQIAVDNIAVSKNEVVHFGDNLVSDIIGAMRAGIESLWIPARRNLSYFKKCGKPFADNYLLPFVANRVPLIENKLTALGYETCGPMIVGFCQWLHEIIHKEQYQQVLFCARDLKQTYEIYKKMYPVDSDRINYFYVSLKSLELPYKAIIGEDNSENAVKQLKIMKSYLMQIGCSGKVAIVDSGISGRTQKMLSRILEEQCSLTGLYMRISKCFFKNVDASKASVFLYPKKPNVRYYICASFFETIIAATHGRTNSYIVKEDGHVLPVLGQQNPCTDIIKSFQEGVASFSDDFNASLLHDYLIKAEYIQEVFLNFAFFPDQKDVAILEKVTGGDEIYNQIVMHRKPYYYFIHAFDFFRDLQLTYWKGGFLRQHFSCVSPIICRFYSWLDCFILDFIGAWRNSIEPK